MDTTPANWRAMTEGERAVLDRLLTEAFPGRDELAAQTEHALVSRIDRDGSLQFRATGPLAQVTQRVPVEGRYFDVSSGSPRSSINLLLHIVDGRLHELEIYKDDGSEIAVGPFEVPINDIEIWPS